MCSQFLLRAYYGELQERFKLDLSEATLDSLVELRALPYRMAPVVIMKDGKRTLHTMNFSLIPAWAKEPKMKFATHNARIETVLEKPTWKKPFLSKRALVPMTGFIEPIYLHRLAGNMVRFHEEKNPLLVAAALYDEWKDPKSGKTLESFAILTREPPSFVKETGHDRCPIFLKEEAFDEWLNPANHDPVKLMEILKSNIDVERPWSADIDRPMAKGWEKRIPATS